MFLVFLRKILKRDVDAGQLSTKGWLAKRGIHTSGVQVHLVNDEKIASTEEYLKKQGIDRDAVTTAELRKAEVVHRLSSRKLVLLSLVIPMSIAPFWLMVLLSLPAFDKKPYSERMQAAFLTALVSDFAGLYYVITRDLFPNGEGSSRRTSKDETDEDEDPTT